MNPQIQQFKERIEASLKFHLDDIEWWNDLVARDVCTPEHARGYVLASQKIVANNRLLLSFL